MSNLLPHNELHHYLDEIAEAGCAEVNRLLLKIDKGHIPSQIAHLDERQQQQVIRELRSVMAVYTECKV